MKILDIQIIRGPNYWSNNRHRLIVMKLDLQEMEETPSDEIEGFADRLEQLIPSLYEHRCSPGQVGGFFKRVRRGTWMGHVVEHIALEIQTLSGMKCNFGKTRGIGEKGIYDVVFSYREERAGVYAAKASVRIVKALIEGKPYDLEKDLQALREIRQEDQFGPSTWSIIQEARRRNIPYLRLHRNSLVQLGYGIHQKLISATITGDTSGIGIDIAGDKSETKYLLSQAGIPVPEGEIIYAESELQDVLRQIGFPCVIKPFNGNQGKGATINISSEKEARKAYAYARRFSDRIIVERYVAGADFRLLVVNYKLVAAAKRTPAHVTGDGSSTIQELITMVNSDHNRGSGHENKLTRIPVDEGTLNLLKSQHYTLQSVLPPNKKVYLKTTANLSTGGTSTNVTDTVHPDNIFMAERIARIVGLDICGIDVVAKGLALPLTETGGAVLEVNAAPGFRMHLHPTTGLPINVAEPVVNMLFPEGKSTRIPIVSVTGTNGKTTTTRLIAHIFRNVGHKVGFTTSDGIYIQDKLLLEGDCTGPKSARFVLRDPTVDFAVLEIARGGILREGLGYTESDIGIVTNIASDHLGMKGIHTLEQLAQVKSVVVENVNKEGHAVLNADDDHVYAMRAHVKSKIALFSMNKENPRIVEHCQSGGVAAVYDEGYITIYSGTLAIKIDHVQNIPLTFCGKAEFMIENVLPAALSAFLRGVKPEDIRQALQSFVPSPDLTPGRMNLFEFNNFSLLLDHAHNPAGIQAIGKFLKNLGNYSKVGIISGTGDRRDEDIIELGKVSAEVFDEIVIRRAGILRGRDPQELIDLMLEGIRKVDENLPVTIVADEQKAILCSVEKATKGTYITLISDDIPMAIGFLKDLKRKEQKSRPKKRVPVQPKTTQIPTTLQPGV